MPETQLPICPGSKPLTTRQRQFVAASAKALLQQCELVDRNFDPTPGVDAATLLELTKGWSAAARVPSTAHGLVTFLCESGVFCESNGLLVLNSNHRAAHLPSDLYSLTPKELQDALSRKPGKANGSGRQVAKQHLIQPRQKHQQYQHENQFTKKKRAQPAPPDIALVTAVALRAFLRKYYSTASPRPTRSRGSAPPGDAGGPPRFQMAQLELFAAITAAEEVGCTVRKLKQLLIRSGIFEMLKRGKSTLVQLASGSDLAAARRLWPDLPDDLLSLRPAEAFALLTGSGRSCGGGGGAAAGFGNGFGIVRNAAYDGADADGGVEFADPLTDDAGPAANADADADADADSDADADAEPEPDLYVDVDAEDFGAKADGDVFDAAVARAAAAAAPAAGGGEHSPLADAPGLPAAGVLGCVPTTATNAFWPLGPDGARAADEEHEAGQAAAARVAATEAGPGQSPTQGLRGPRAPVVAAEAAANFSRGTSTSTLGTAAARAPALELDPRPDLDPGPGPDQPPGPAAWPKLAKPRLWQRAEAWRAASAGGGARATPPMQPAQQSAVQLPPGLRLQPWGAAPVAAAAGGGRGAGPGGWVSGGALSGHGLISPVALLQRGAPARLHIGRDGRGRIMMRLQDEQEAAPRGPAAAAAAVADGGGARAGGRAGGAAAHDGRDMEADAGDEEADGELELFLQVLPYRLRKEVRCRVAAAQRGDTNPGVDPAGGGGGFPGLHRAPRRRRAADGIRGTRGGGGFDRFLVDIAVDAGRAVRLAFSDGSRQIVDVPVSIEEAMRSLQRYMQRAATAGSGTARGPAKGPARGGGRPPGLLGAGAWAGGSTPLGGGLSTAETAPGELRGTRRDGAGAGGGVYGDGGRSGAGAAGGGKRPREASAAAAEMAGLADGCEPSAKRRQNGPRPDPGLNQPGGGDGDGDGDDDEEEEDGGAISPLQLFGSDNRCCPPSTLHRISAMFNPLDGSVYGLTYRVGRHIPGLAEALRDVLTDLAGRGRRAAPGPKGEPLAGAGGLGVGDGGHVGGGVMGGHPTMMSTMVMMPYSQPALPPPRRRGAGAGGIARNLRGSLLLLGRPGSGKTTLLRDIARLLADDLALSVVVVDTSNEVAGGDVRPHVCIGSARRVMVGERGELHRRMLEAVQNHGPDVVVVDEIANCQEADAARTISQRGVMLVAAAHGTDLEGLLHNGELNSLVGGLQTVTLGDQRADRMNGGSKTRTERCGAPTFRTLVEVLDCGRLRLRPDVAASVDSLLGNSGGGGRGCAGGWPSAIDDCSPGLSTSLGLLPPPLPPPWSPMLVPDVACNPGVHPQHNHYRHTKHAKHQPQKHHHHHHRHHHAQQQRAWAGGFGPQPAAAAAAVDLGGDVPVDVSLQLQRRQAPPPEQQPGSLLLRWPQEAVAAAGSGGGVYGGLPVAGREGQWEEVLEPLEQLRWTRPERMPAAAGVGAVTAAAAGGQTGQRGRRRQGALYVRLMRPTDTVPEEEEEEEEEEELPDRLNGGWPAAHPTHRHDAPPLARDSDRTAADPAGNQMEVDDVDGAAAAPGPACETVPQNGEGVGTGGGGGSAGGVAAAAHAAILSGDGAGGEGGAAAASPARHSPSDGDGSGGSGCAAAGAAAATPATHCATHDGGSAGADDGAAASAQARHAFRLLACSDHSQRTLSDWGGDGAGADLTPSGDAEDATSRPAAGCDDTRMPAAGPAGVGARMREASLEADTAALEAVSGA